MRRSGNVAPRETDVRRPSNVADPVGVAVKDVLLDPRLVLFIESPNFDDIVASCASKALDGCLAHGRLVRCGGGCGCNECAGAGGGGPGYSVAADGMGFKDVGAPLTIICKNGL